MTDLLKVDVDGVVQDALTVSLVHHDESFHLGEEQTGESEQMSDCSSITHISTNRWGGGSKDKGKDAGGHKSKKYMKLNCILSRKNTNVDVRGRKLTVKLAAIVANKKTSCKH